MKRSKKNKHTFDSMAQIEKKYLPRSSQIGEENRLKDADSLGILMARSSVAKIKTLLVDQTDLS